MQEEVRDGLILFWPNQDYLFTIDTFYHYSFYNNVKLEI